MAKNGARERSRSVEFGYRLQWRQVHLNAAVFRTGETLQEGHNLIHEVYGAMPDIHVTDRSLTWNSDLVETLLNEAERAPTPDAPAWVKDVWVNTERRYEIGRAHV